MNPRSTFTVRLRRIASFGPFVFAFAATALTFLSVKNLSLLPHLYLPYAELGILAVGMTAVMLTGGIDLSVGSLVCLCAVAGGAAALRHGHVAGWSVALVVGLLGGLFNALLIASKTAPLLVTLGSMTLFAGAATAISRGEAILLDEPTWLSTKPLGVSAGFWILAMVAAAGIWLVRFHRIGRYLIAVGENERAAVRAGAPVTATVVAAYGLTGLLAGVAAILLTERGRSVIPIPEPGLELRVIACVILGGTRVTGGFGGVERTLVGLLILAGVEQSLGLLGSIRFKLPWSDQTTYLPQDWRYILIGVIVIVTGCLNERLIGRRRRD